ncbi:hypothetical protein ACQ4PT_037134 [Festuca glaucescens]
MATPDNNPHAPVGLAYCPGMVLTHRLGHLLSDSLSPGLWSLSLEVYCRPVHATALHVHPSWCAPPRWMGIVQGPDGLVDSVLNAQREAAASFGTNTLLIENQICRQSFRLILVKLLCLFRRNLGGFEMDGGHIHWWNLDRWDNIWCWSFPQGNILISRLLVASLLEVTYSLVENLVHIRSSALQ